MVNYSDNILFTKENVEQIVVPEIVKDDLLSIIEEKLTKTGFYYRIAYRVKTVDSTLNKLKMKDYRRPGTDNEDKKMQDLIGIRIMLYYADDVEICRSLLNNLFSTPGSWETTEINEYEFKAMKVNGIFQLPAYLKKTIVNPMLKEYIDDTFEIQVRTNSFEGWHEIEHDLRYKGSAFGIGNEGLARKMNSILATLELCDDSVVGLLEDLGHAHYKDKNWNDMIRCHYRIKFENEPLHPYIEKLFDADTELAKKFFKFKRGPLLAQLWENTSDKGLELTVNNIIKIVNMIGPDDPRIKETFMQIERERASQEIEFNNKRKKFEPFKELGTYTVFSSDTQIDLSNLSISDAFRKATGYIYSWIKSRFGEVFPDLPENVASYMGGSPGYSVAIEFDEEKIFFHQKSTHLDTKISCRMWISEAFVQAMGDKLMFSVSNRYAEPLDRYRDNENILFSRPNFYGEIADNIGLIDVERVRESVKHVDEPDRLEMLIRLIDSSERRFPVVVFLAEDDTWLDKFDVNYFAYLVGYYAHIRIIDQNDLALKFADKYDLDEDMYRDSITVFYPGQDPVTSYKSDILDSRYEVIKLEKKKYWNETGCRAYRRQLVSQIREHNIL
ncbi:MAG: hypothetical protein ACI4E1_03145 [Lachnospira sp.]